MVHSTPGRRVHSLYPLCSFKDTLLHGLSRLASGVRSIPLPHVEFDHHMRRDEKMPFLTTKYIVLDAYLSNTCLGLSILEK